MQGQVNSQLQINGISLESPPKPVSEAYFKALADIHCNFIGIVPYGYSRQGEGQVYYNSQRQWWGERPEGVRTLANMAKANGMAVMIKPQVWMNSHWIGAYT